jgi:hypothetical protein
MTDKLGITADTATVSRSSVELILRQHQIPYDLAGTEPVANPIERRGGQSPYHLLLSNHVTDEEETFLDKVLDTPDSDDRRTARFLYVHGREHRAVFVTGNTALFGEPDSAKRGRLARLAGTRILSVAEFERWCSEPQP